MKRSAPATSRPTNSVSSALSVEGHPRPSTRRQGGQRPLSFRDGHRHRQDPHCRRRHQTLSAHRQCQRVLFLVDRLELEDQAEESHFTAAVAVRRFQDGHLQGEPRRLAAGRNRRHHRAVAAFQQQIPAALLADRFRSGHLRRSPSLHRRQCPRRFRLLHRL